MKLKLALFNLERGDTQEKDSLETDKILNGMENINRVLLFILRTEGQGNV